MAHSDLSVIQEFVPAGASGVRHYHQKARQFFFIPGDQAVMEVGGQLLTLCLDRPLWMVLD